MPVEGQDKEESREKREELEKVLLPKLCEVMDDLLLDPVVDFKEYLSFQPLDMEKIWEEQLAAVRRSESKSASETDGYYAKRTAIKASIGMDPFRQEQEKIYADLAGNHCALFQGHDPRYVLMCESIQQIAAQYPAEFVHAYLCYRQDQLMQKCCVRDSKIKEDYLNRIKPIYDKWNYTQMVYDMAEKIAPGIIAEEEARKKRKEQLQAQEAKEKEEEKKRKAQEAKQKEEEEKRKAQEAKQKEEEEKRIAQEAARKAQEASITERRKS